MMKVCPKCRNWIRDNADVCEYCGCDLIEERFNREYMQSANNHFEYKLIRFHCDAFGELPIEEIEVKLTDLSSEGWRLHTVFTESSKTDEKYRYIEFDDRLIGPYKLPDDEIKKSYITGKSVVFVLERVIE